MQQNGKEKPAKVKRYPKKKKLVYKKNSVDLMIGKDAEFKTLISRRQRWQFNFEHVCQKNSCWIVDQYTGRPAELVVAIVYVRENVLIGWLAEWQSWQCMYARKKLLICWSADRQSR